MRACLWQDVVGVFETNRQDIYQIRHRARTADSWYSWSCYYVLSHQDRLSFGEVWYKAVSKEKKRN